MPRDWWGRHGKPKTKLAGEKRRYGLLRLFIRPLRIACSVLHLEAGTKNLLYAATVHLLAGAVTGSVFKVHMLLLWVFVIAAEAAILSATNLSTAALWASANLCSIEAGYVLGLFSRRIMEQAGYIDPVIRTPRPR
jgi:hypothetical protein